MFVVAGSREFLFESLSKSLATRTLVVRLAHNPHKALLLTLQNKLIKDHIQWERYIELDKTILKLTFMNNETETKTGRKCG